MLAVRGLRGTFYVPFAGPRGKPTLRATNLGPLLDGGFEIGAHTLSHQILIGMPDGRLWDEVTRSKHMLEQALGQDIVMFCYPRGRYDGRVLRAVREAGYLGARTTRMLCQALQFPQFEMPTTLQAYPHPPLDYLKNLGKRRDLLGLCRYLTRSCWKGSWVELGKRLFDDVLSEGGIWHLYGHSWEIEELDLWAHLGELLDYVSNRPGSIYATNRHALELQQQGQPSGIPQIV
jgi:peptidoglycan-N-acetylglucosamine deacetylase